MDNSTILLVNIFLYVGALIYQSFHRSFFSMGSAVIGLYLLVSIIAMDFFLSPYSFHNDLKLFPFIYLFVVLMMMSKPLLDFDETKTRRILICKSKIIDLVSALNILFIVLMTLYNLSGKSLGAIFDPAAILETYNDSHDALDSMEASGPMLITLPYYILKDLTIPLFLYYFMRKEKRFIYLLLGCIVLLIFNGLLEASRGFLFALILAVPFIYCCIGERLSKKYQRVFKFSIVAAVGSVLFGFYTISYARYGTESEELLTSSLENYASQSVLCFNNYGLDAGGIRYGDRTMPIVRKLLGLKTSTNYYERRDTYRNMKIDDSYFITFVGDFTLDFGPVLGSLILGGFAFFFFKMLPHRGFYTFSQILLLYMLYRWVMGGVILWPYAEKTGNMTLGLYFILFLVLRYNEHKVLLNLEQRNSYA